MPYTDKQKQREAQRRHYEANREAYAARSLANRTRILKEVRDLILTYLKSHPCVDCGEDDPIVLEFDHRDPRTKLFNVGEAAQRKFAASTVAAEIAKCDVRCANCHRRMTYMRGGYRHKG